MTVELRDVLVLLPTREQLRLVVGVSVQESGADWGYVWGRVTVGVTVTMSGGRGQAAGLWSELGDIRAMRPALPSLTGSVTYDPTAALHSVSLSLSGSWLWLGPRECPMSRG